MSTVRILGIDPGLNHTGWGVIESEGGVLKRIASGVIEPPKGKTSSRLGVIARALSDVIRTHRPTTAACERVFVNVNPQSTLLLGQARGAALTAAALGGLVVEEFTPSEIKQAVTASGRADKLMVQEMVGRLLNLSGALQSDEADALACAICAASNLRLRALECSGGTSRTYAIARRGASARGARSAWTKLVEGKEKKK